MSADPRFSVRQFVRAWTGEAIPKWEGSEAIVSWGITWTITWTITLVAWFGIPASVIAAIGVSPGFFVAAFACLCLVFIAPYRLWRDANLERVKTEEQWSAANLALEESLTARINALEAKLRPKMSVSAGIVEGPERGRNWYDYAYRAHLEVKNEGIEPLKDCRVRLISCRARIDDLLLDEFKGQTPYFRWAGKNDNEDTCDVYTHHAAEIAVGRSHSGGAYIRGTRPTIDAALNVREAGAFPIHDGQLYYVTLEVTAANSSPVTQTFLLQFATDSKFEAD